MRYQLELDVRERTWIRKGQGISKPPKENYPYLVVTDLSWSADWSKEMLLLVWQQEHQPLTDEQKVKFLENINVDQILTYPSEAIARLIPDHKKLDSLRKALWEDLGVLIEYFEEDLGMVGECPSCGMEVTGVNRGCRCE